MKGSEISSITDLSDFLSEREFSCLYSISSFLSEIKICLFPLGCRDGEFSQIEYDKEFEAISNRVAVLRAMAYELEEVPGEASEVIYQIETLRLRLNIFASGAVMEVLEVDKRIPDFALEKSDSVDYYHSFGVPLDRIRNVNGIPTTTETLQDYYRSGLFHTADIKDQDGGIGMYFFRYQVPPARVSSLFRFMRERALNVQQNWDWDAIAHAIKIEDYNDFTRLLEVAEKISNVRKGAWIFSKKQISQSEKLQKLQSGEGKLNLLLELLKAKGELRVEELIEAFSNLDGGALSVQEWEIFGVIYRNRFEMPDEFKNNLIDFQSRGYTLDCLDPYIKNCRGIFYRKNWGKDLSEALTMGLKFPDIQEIYDNDCSLRLALNCSKEGIVDVYRINLVIRFLSGISEEGVHEGDVRILTISEVPLVDLNYLYRFFDIDQIRAICSLSQDKEKLFSVLNFIKKGDLEAQKAVDCISEFGVSVFASYIGVRTTLEEYDLMHRFEIGVEYLDEYGMDFCQKTLEALFDCIDNQRGSIRSVVILSLYSKGISIEDITELCQVYIEGLEAGEILLTFPQFVYFRQQNIEERLVEDIQTANVINLHKDGFDIDKIKSYKPLLELSDNSLEMAVQILGYLDVSCGDLDEAFAAMGQPSIKNRAVVDVKDIDYALRWISRSTEEGSKVKIFMDHYRLEKIMIYPPAVIKAMVNRFFGGVDLEVRKKRAIFIQGVSDWNSYSYGKSNKEGLCNLLDGYEIDIFQASSIDDLPGIFANYDEGVIDLVSLSGHANPKSLHLGFTDQHLLKRKERDSSGVINTDNVDALEQFRKYLKPGAIGLILGCSAGGEVEDGHANIAEDIKAKLGLGLAYAARGSHSSVNFLTDSSGKTLESVLFNDGMIETVVLE